jgi:ABC-type polysaccharide/polyol phosphate transport system ATPase subunit
MNPYAIRAERLGKKYRIQHQERHQYVALRDVIAGSVKRAAASVLGAGRRVTGRGAPAASASIQRTEDFWALKNVSFDLAHGETVGIIGRNGAGKSTLLKVLSRITEPTEGRARLRGRVASLLEVGTGFHPELTGRENIFLNGAILGMSRAEIRSKFDEIVAFAEVERFLDTPVKRFSSGMYVRLAFAVAAHLEPEILVVDEVLAVGDAEFQKKCLGRMGGAASEGRTILFVSHQMNQIRRLCCRCLWFHGGQLRMDGATAEVIAAYETASFGSDGGPEDSAHYRIQMLGWHVTDMSGEASNVIHTDGPITVRFRIKSNVLLRIGHHSIALFRGDQMVWGMEVQNFALDPGLQELVYQLPSLPLMPGAYTWRLVVYDHRGPVEAWDCRPQLVIGTMPATYARPEWTGLINVPCEFSIVQAPADVIAPAAAAVR